MRRAIFFFSFRLVRSALLFALFSTAAFGCANAQTPDDGAPAAAPSDTTPVVIADGTALGQYVDLSAWTSPAMPQTVAAARAHWQAQDPEYEEEVLVMSVAEGAFTGPGASQQAVLYLMSAWPRCCPKMGIAVIEDGALVRNVAFEAPAHALASIPDLDGDGRDELAVTGSFGMGGENSTSVTLVSLADSGLRTWGGAMIQYDACGAMEEGGTAARIIALPGPAFTIEQFSRASCETGEWQSGGPPQPFEFPAPEEETSVELPL